MIDQSDDGLLHDRVHVDPTRIKESPLARLHRERDELADALRDAMMDCDHMLLAGSVSVRQWIADVTKVQSKLRDRLARVNANVAD